MFAKSHIRGAINAPIESILAANSKQDLAKILQVPSINTEDRQSLHLLMHCQLSLIRGPKAAAHVERVLKSFEVCLLEGGFKEFYNTYSIENPSLIVMN